MTTLQRLERWVAHRNRVRLTADHPIDPARLTRAERDALTDELYEVHQQIFDGVGRASFRRYVIEPSAADTRIQVFRTPDGSAAGYMALHAYTRRDDHGPLVVIRAEAGILRRYRGHTPQARFSLTQALRLWLKHLGKRKYFFACPIHPGSYWGVTKRCDRSWPRPEQPTPPEVHRLMTDLAGSFSLPQAARDPLVRKVGWITRETPADEAHWKTHPAQEVRYYRSRNPSYAKGNGLLMLVPLTLNLLLTATWRVGLRCLFGRR